MEERDVIMLSNFESNSIKSSKFIITLFVLDKDFFVKGVFLCSENSKSFDSF